MSFMTSLLLYAHTESTWVIALQWGAGVLLLIFLFVLIFVQRRTGKRLKDELEELDKIRRGNVEYDFILKAMKIAVWRYDAQTKAFVYEKDYREGSNNYVPVTNESFQEMLAVIAPADVEHVNKAFSDICEGRTDFYHQEYQVMDRASGITYWEESYATIVDRDADGKPTKIVGTSQRIDGRKELMASLVTARNKAKDYLRARRPMPMDIDELELPDRGDSLDEALIRKERAKLVRKAIRRMTPKDREIFLRYYYYLQSTERISEIMGIPTGTVRSRLYRGRKLLQKILSKEDVLQGAFSLHFVMPIPWQYH